MPTADDFDDKVAEPSGKRGFNRWTDEIIRSLGIRFTENSERVRVETIDLNLAFHGIDGSPASNDKIHFAARFVPPEMQAFSPSRRTKDV